MITTELERRLLNDYQRNFPLIHRPFQMIAEQLGADEHTITGLLSRFRDAGVISRIGPVFRPNTVGSSTLAAMSVPPPLLPDVANTVNGYAEVNHNYEREHHFNLWFVVTAATRPRRDAVLAEIAEVTGFGVMTLPLVRDYYIDLGFDLDFGDAAPSRPAPGVAAAPSDADGAAAQAQTATDLVFALQGGLPLVAAPYEAIARQTGLSERIVIGRVCNMLGTGAIKRFGVVVRHHELGYRANAMCVWDVPDQRVDRLGERLAREPAVTLCYRRPRRLPDWPYNLFCMIHGKDRSKVIKQVDGLVDRFDLRGVPGAVLFSGRRFKQRGAYYRRSDVDPLVSVHSAHG